MADLITQERLKNLLSYNSENGEFKWVRPTSNRVRVGQIAGAVNSTDAYVRIMIDGKIYSAHRLAWLYVNGSHPFYEIDHIDGDHGNNRITNLREATRKQNQENTRLQKNNKSGHRGVVWDSTNNKWKAYVNHTRVHNHIGLFTSLEKAAIAAKGARDKLFTHHHTPYSS